MRDSGDTRRAAIDENPALVRALASLAHFSPAAGFEDRVMARVVTPAPMWVQQLRRWRVSLVETGRMRWLLGGLAGASGLSLSMVVAFLAASGGAARDSLGQLLVDVGLPFWRALLGVTAEVARDIYGIACTVALPGAVWVAIGLGGCLTMVLDLWILRRLTQPTGVTTVKLNASH